MIEEIRQTAADLLENKTVDVIIGFGRGRNDQSVSPVFITQKDEVEQLVWNQACLNNLSVYLNRPGVKALGKPAIVAKGCDIKSIIGLIQENQIKREDVVIIGVDCAFQGSPEPLEKCLSCDCHTVKDVDRHIQDAELKSNLPEASDAALKRLEELENKTPEERWEFWQEKLKNCIKCYACRQVCPLCYCNRCIVEKFTPQWISPSASQQGNLSWNVIRSYHLAGRCVGCGECERACPMDIPLGIVNQKMAKVIAEEFEYEAGEDIEKKPPLSDFNMEDDNSFFR